jgi:asparagine synthase (glutamine-hydrolysing)
VCGIAGQFNWRTGRPVDPNQLAWLGYAMRHRGPDGEGTHLDGPVGFAHRRLAIIDLEGGHQPMSTPDGSLWIVYNGEVYNYVELIDELRCLGHRPRTRSDTEAVLLAYAQWGLDFPERLNGMFAMAIWDSRLRRLVLCRDRLGIKPLYYAETSDGTAFASELKALRTIDGVAEEIDLAAFDEYMTCGYVVHPRTLLCGVRKLEPGTLVMVTAQGGAEPRRYWSLRPEPDDRASRAQWNAQIRDTFTDSVRLRLRSDVPLGTLLSGGVDSTLIASTMTMLGGGGDAGIDSFCVGVDLPGVVNEFDWAREVARGLSLRHHEQRLSPMEYGATLTDACQLLDEPLMEPMVGQLLAVCRFAREHVTVVLSGEGSDETWLGYPGYRIQYAIELLQRLLPRSAWRSFVRPLDRAANLFPPKAAKYLRLLAEPLERRYLGLNYFDTTVKDTLYSAKTRDMLEQRDPREAFRRLYDEAGGAEPLSRMAAIDSRAWLVNNTLLRSDQMSMASSLELRVPFLDHRLVELSSRVPARFKIDLHHEKVILKQALADRLPRRVARRRKVGFPTPIAELLRAEWGHEAAEVMLSPVKATADLLDRARIRQLIQQHRSGRADWSRVLFQVLMLEYWARKLETRPSHP